MSLKRKIAINTLAQFIGRGLNIVLAAVTISFVTRILQPEKYGFYTIALTILSLVALFADFGAYGNLVRDLSQTNDEKKFKQLYGSVFSFRLVWALLIYSISGIVIFFLNVDPIVKAAFAILSISSFFSSLNSLLIVILQVRYRMTWAVVGDVLNRLCMFGLLIWILFAKLDFYFVFWAGSAASIINFLFVFFFVRKSFAFTFKWPKSLIIEFAKNSVLLGLASLLGVVHFRIDTIILSIGHSAKDVGIYGVAYKIFETGIFLPAVFVGMMMPSFSQSCGAADQTRFQALLQKTFDCLALMVFPIATVLFWSASWIIQVMGGKEYMNAALPLYILAFALIPNFLCSIFSIAFVSAKKLKSLILAVLIYLLIDAPVVFLLVWQWSYIGAAISTVFSEVITIVIMLIFSKKILNFIPKFAIVFRLLPVAIFSNIIAFLFCFSVKDFTLNIQNSLISVTLLLVLVVGAYSIWLIKSRLVSFNKLRPRFNF